MEVKGKILKNADVSYLDKVFLKDGLLEPVPSSVLDHVPPEHVMMWCVRNAVYQLPTIELIDWLREHTGIEKGFGAIEICAGKSGIGRALGIKATDSYVQVADPALQVYYAMFNQPIVEPPEYVERMEANEAVQHYKPNVVVGAWVTQRWLSEADEEANVYGPLEEEWVDAGTTYIHIGNIGVHSKKRILSRPHDRYQYPWLRSRAHDPSLNAIWVWNPW
jgi:hypothetical protein